MSGPEPHDEFDDLDRLFRPLADSVEARGLRDDVAVVSGRPGWDLVITTDTIVEGVHFLTNDPLDQVARKLLRVNLSDLAAKGAEPWAYLLTVSWPPTCRAEMREQFAAGLKQDQARYGLKLLGGDTTSTSGPLTCGMTAFGWAPQGQIPSRAGARPGDVILVSGAIGDGLLGLRAAQGRLMHLEPERQGALIQRYRLPEPRTVLARAVRAHVSASADVSDGLIADLAHIAQASGVRAEVRLEAVPHSAAATAWLSHRADPVAAAIDLATGGDDYEIVCTARPDHAAALQREARATGIPFTPIGQIVAGQGVGVSLDGDPVSVEESGWRHGARATKR